MLAEPDLALCRRSYPGPLNLIVPTWFVCICSGEVVMLLPSTICGNLFIAGACGRGRRRNALRGLENSLTLAPCLRRSGAHCRKTSDSSWPRHNLNRRSSGMGWSLLGRRIRVIVSAFGRWRDIANSLAKKHGRAWAGVVRSVGDCLFI